MDFKTAMTTMAAARPDVEASLLVDLALAIENALPPNLDDAAALGKWAARQPSVAQWLNSDSTSAKIHAIKELRALTNASLRQSKDAIEALA